jgi:exocyst complex component 2
MHKTILMLVEVHAKVGDTVPTSANGLVNRVLIALVTKVTEVALRCFQQVPKYGTGGMLTVSFASSSFPRFIAFLPSTTIVEVQS